MNRPQEVEAKLLAAARPVTGLWQELTALRGLDGHVLAPLPDQHISDRYFDTTHGALRHADLALRVREADDGCTVAIKGRSFLSANVVTRLEFERPCSREALAEMLALLREHGIDLVSATPTPPASGMDEALVHRGLVPWQARTTQRQRREIRFRTDTLTIARTYSGRMPVSGRGRVAATL